MWVDIFNNKMTLEPKLKEGIILSNVFESAGRYVLTEDKRHWKDEFEHWVNKLRETSPALADIYRDRFYNNSRYVR